MRVRGKPIEDVLQVTGLKVPRNGRSRRKVPTDSGRSDVWNLDLVEAYLSADSSVLDGPGSPVSPQPN